MLPMLIPAAIATVTMAICRDENHDNRGCQPIVELEQRLIILLPSELATSYRITLALSTCKLKEIESKEIYIKRQSCGLNIRHYVLG